MKTSPVSLQNDLFTEYTWPANVSFNFKTAIWQSQTLSIVGRNMDCARKIFPLLELDKFSKALSNGRAAKTRYRTW